MNKYELQEAFPGHKVCLELQAIDFNDSQCQGMILSNEDASPAVSQVLEVEITTF